MKYMLNIFTDERGMTDATPEQIRETMEAYGAFGKEVEDKGVHLAGEGLQPTATATTVQVRDRRDASSRTARSPRPRSSSAASTCSSARTSTRRSAGRRRSRERRSGRSRCGR